MWCAQTNYSKKRTISTQFAAIFTGIRVYNHAALLGSFVATMIRFFWLHKTQAQIAPLRNWYSIGTPYAALTAGVELCGHNYTVTSYVSRLRMRGFVDAKWQKVGPQLGCSSTLDVTYPDMSSPLCYCANQAFSKHSDRIDTQFVDNSSITDPLMLRTVVDTCNTDAGSALTVAVSACVTNERTTQYVAWVDGENMVVPADIVVLYAWLHMCQFGLLSATGSSGRHMWVWVHWLSTTAVVYTTMVLIEPRVWLGVVLVCSCMWFLMLSGRCDKQSGIWLSYGSTLVLLGILADLYTGERDSYILLVDVFLNAVITAVAQTTHSIVSYYIFLMHSHKSQFDHKHLTLWWETALLLWLCHAGVACIRLVSDTPRLLENETNDSSFIINIAYNLLCLLPVIVCHPTVQYRIAAPCSSIILSVLQSVVLTVVTITIVV